MTDNQQQQPVTRAELAETEARILASIRHNEGRIAEAVGETIAASEGRIAEAVGKTIAASEGRIAKAVGNAIAASEERTVEQVREIETRLLTEFHKWAPTIEKRLRGTAAAVSNVDERLALLEDRVATLERGHP